MLRTNLATRPFYNERALYVGLMVAGVVAIALTLFVLVRIVALSQQQADLGARIARDEAEASRLQQSAARVRQGIDQQELEAVIAGAREANAVIARRTFSWTELFNRIEATLPPDVMLTAIRPDFEQGQTRIHMSVLGRAVDGIDRFMEQLEEGGAFSNVLLREERRTEEGTYLVTLAGVYHGPEVSETSTEELAPAPEGTRTANAVADDAGRSPSIPTDVQTEGQAAAAGAQP